MPSFHDNRAFCRSLMAAVGSGALLAAGAASAGGANAQAMIDLTPDFAGQSWASAVSADGSVIIGAREDETGVYAFRASGGTFDIRGPAGNYSIPHAISADGRVIIGITAPDLQFDILTGYKYENGVLTSLGTLGGSATYPIGVSADGRVIVGASFGAGGQVWRAFRYEGGRIQDLGAPGGVASAAYAVSADGRVIVGVFQAPGNEQYLRAFRHANNVITDLGTLGGASATAMFVSADGSIIAGNSSLASGDERAFRHAGGVMTDLGTLGGLWSSVSGLSADGSVVVGVSGTAQNGPVRAFKHENGRMTDLGTLGGTYSLANAVSADGRVVVGRSALDGDIISHAFKYQNGRMTDLGTLGGSYSDAVAVSADGGIIVGRSYLAEDQGVHAFVYRNGPLIDLDNTAAAISKSARNTQSAMAMRTGALALMMDYDCNAFGAHNVCLSFGGRYGELNSSHGEGAGQVTLAYRVAPNVRIGAFVDFRVSQRAPSGLNYRADAPTFGGFIGYGATDGRGLQGKLTVAANHGGVTATRDASLANTEAGQGRASLNSWAVAGEIGWGFAFSDNWIATPYAGLRVMEAKLGSYSETLTESVQFPLSYAGVSQHVTTLFGGLRVNGKLSDKISLFASLGLEGDLSSRMDDVRGTSDLPGMESFTIRNTTKANSVRPFGSLGLGYDLTSNQRISAQLALRGSPYGSQVSKTALVSWRIAF